MNTYKNLGGNSGVDAYESGPDYIAVRFKDGGSVYTYTNASAGSRNIDRMKQLAIAGRGLNTFISQNVRDRYARKL